MAFLNRAHHEGVHLYTFPYLINKGSHTSPGVVFKRNVVRVQVPAVLPFVTPFRRMATQSFGSECAWIWEARVDCGFQDL